MASLSDLDTLSRALVLRLQLDDVIALEDKKEKRRKGDISDIDHAVQSFRHELALADNLGLQRCYVCRRVVELDTGCNHISKSSLPIHSFKHTC